MDEICKTCQNYVSVTCLGKTVELCGGNVDDSSKCAMRQDLYKNHPMLCTKAYLRKLLGMNDEKMMRLLCRSEFAHIKRVKKDKMLYIAVTPKDIDDLKRCKRGCYAKTDER